MNFFIHLFKISILLTSIISLIACGDGPMDAAVNDFNKDSIRIDDESHLLSNILHSSSSVYSGNPYNSTYSSSSSVYSENPYNSTYFSSSSVYSENPYNSTYSSSEDVSIYTYKPTIIRITITYFEQTSEGWDVQGGYSDGDPRIHFIIKTYSDGIIQDSVTTKTANLGDNVGIWNGKEELTANLSGGIDRILIAPIVIDDELLADDYSSNFSYPIVDVGKKIGQKINQEDVRNQNCILEWNVFIEYK